jgi:molybdate transport system substrate-binding protein
MRRAAPAALAAVALSASLAAPAWVAAQEPHVVSVAAAANLRSAMADLSRVFEQAEPRARVRVTLGATGALHAQIQSGGPFDLFFAADRDHPRRLIDAKLGGPEVLYAIGRLVIWTPPGSPLSFQRSGLSGLTARSVTHIAIANPAASPYGRAAITALQNAGIAQAVQGKLVLGQSVAQAAQLAQSGAADIAILPASIAAEPELSSGKAILVPQELHPRIEQSAVVLFRSSEPALARAFLDFVTGRTGREILKRHQYELP